MVYIYDLILNWSSSRKYEFFEWKDDDEIEYIKKIPIFKIKDFNNIFNNGVKVGKDFLLRICNKAEVYGNKRVDKIEYACIFCNNELSKAVAIEFNEEGDSIYKSNIYFYDLEDVFLLAKKIDLIELEFIISEKDEFKDFYLTRTEINKKKLLLKEINNSYRSNDLDKLKYFYYEVFGVDAKDIEFIYKRLVNSLDNNFDYKHNVIYDVIKIPNFL